MKRPGELEATALLQCAAFMAAGARTAPKTRGVDNLIVCVFDRAVEIRKLARAMSALSRKLGRSSFQRDAESLNGVGCVIVLAVKKNPAGLNCGFCGYADCAALAASKGVCAFNSVDLGIAAGSAASVANRHRIDNRIMYSIGRAALESGILGESAVQALGIPLSVSGKNPFFDRK